MLEHCGTFDIVILTLLPFCNFFAGPMMVHLLTAPEQTSIDFAC